MPPPTVRSEDRSLAAAFGSGAAIGAQLGAHLSPKTKPRSISRLLCVALFVLGLKMILS